MAYTGFDKSKMPPDLQEVYDEVSSIHRGKILPLPPEIEDEIMRMVEGGASDSMVCRALGVSANALWTWRKRAKTGREVDIQARDFITRFDKSRLKCQQTMLKAVQDAAVKNGDWRAAQFLLKSQLPDDFSEQVITARRLAELEAERAEARRAEEAETKPQESTLPAEVWERIAAQALAEAKRMRSIAGDGAPVPSLPDDEDDDEG